MVMNEMIEQSRFYGYINIFLSDFAVRNSFFFDCAGQFCLRIHKVELEN